MSGGPADADGNSFIWGKAAEGCEVDYVAVLLDCRVRGDRSTRPGVDRGARGRDAFGEDDARVHSVDRHRPAVAGDVPVQLVERALFAAGVEEANRVGDAVADDDLPIRVARAGNPDAESARPAVVLALFFYTKPLAGRVSDVADRDVELSRAPLGRVVVERKVADDSIPLAREADCELLGDIERSVGVNIDQRIKVADADGAALRARRIRECEEEQCPTNR